MQKLKGPNICDAGQFSKKLQEVMKGMHELFELTKEYDLAPVDENDVTRYFEEDGKTGFQATGQYERPAEFLQTLLDIIRVNFEPFPMGTWLFNSNMGFMYDEIPDRPFQLAYASLVSDDNQSFASFFRENVSPYLERCGYDVGQFAAIFAVASTGSERYRLRFTSEISTTLNSGFSVPEALGLLAAEMDSSVSKPQKQTYAGYCLVPELGSRIRLSLWCFVKNQKANLQ